MLSPASDGRPRSNPYPQVLTTRSRYRTRPCRHSSTCRGSSQPTPTSTSIAVTNLRSASAASAARTTRCSSLLKLPALTSAANYTDGQRHDHEPERGRQSWMPGLARDQLREQVARAEMVARVKPQQRPAQRLAPLEVAETPRADHQPVQTTQKRSVIHSPPREHTIEVLWQRLLGDPHSSRVMRERRLDIAGIKGEQPRSAPAAALSCLDERRGLGRNRRPRLAPATLSVLTTSDTPMASFTHLIRTAAS
jgi:hypothetical protein